MFSNFRKRKTETETKLKKQRKKLDKKQEAAYKRGIGIIGTNGVTSASDASDEKTHETEDKSPAQFNIPSVVTSSVYQHMHSVAIQGSENIGNPVIQVNRDDNEFKKSALR